MKNFNLSIYKVYYDQIRKGTKKYEYRKLDDYYTKKFIVEEDGKKKAKHYDTVTFYCKGEKPMKVEWLGLSFYPRKNPEWYAIKLGKILE